MAQTYGVLAALPEESAMWCRKFPTRSGESVNVSEISLVADHLHERGRYAGCAHITVFMRIAELPLWRPRGRRRVTACGANNAAYGEATLAPQLGHRLTRR